MIKMLKSSSIAEQEGETTPSRAVSPGGRRKSGGKRMLHTIKAVFARSRAESPAKKGGDVPPSSDKNHTRRSARTALTSLAARGASAAPAENDFVVKWVNMPTIESPTPPHDHLQNLLQERGYSVDTISNMDAGYQDVVDLQTTSLNPEPLQQELVDAIRGEQVEELMDLLEHGVCAPEFPCSSEVGESSMLHWMCKRGQVDCLRPFLEKGAPLKSCEGYGLTPLHSACLAPTTSFALVDLLLEQDKTMLFVMDDRGCPPLYYTRSNHWPAWKEYLEAKANEYWPNQQQSETKDEPEKEDEQTQQDEAEEMQKEDHREEFIESNKQELMTTEQSEKEEAELDQQEEAEAVLRKEDSKEDSSTNEPAVTLATPSGQVEA
uniref:Uncharacterized protein n=1 Tax=Entomoneis paludosa TaxID=265537 RepID=A0A7S2Y2I1_9STRA|eukprot:CAMPEP_0172440208 /NCGR_PEP_ID=MMETSP1065-20121228/919_1 /TAXON_ID=265537 /ORGANISM="Amphiprora paludosa, Strain CCMP125" /LENGTH=377 /DNA_ID=CAMNT_0013188993 /DNA_START=51 /DNA_END=1184 /DNA_ORIENTATION=+